MTLLAIEVILTKMDDIESTVRDYEIAWCDLKDWLDELNEKPQEWQGGDLDDLRRLMDTDW